MDSTVVLLDSDPKSGVRYLTLLCKLGKQSNQILKCHIHSLHIFVTQRFGLLFRVVVLVFLFTDRAVNVIFK